MRTLITFEVEEKPIPKPGLVPNGHRGVRYPEPAATKYRAFKSILRAAADRKLPDDWSPTAEPCVVRIVLQFPRFKYQVGDDSLFWHILKPDLENAGSKPILDSLTGLVWEDDDQVVIANQAKVWAPDRNPVVTVQVVALGPDDTGLEWVREAIGWDTV